MSSVPPNLVGPILQSPLVQRFLAGSREIERGQEFTALRQQNAAVDASDSTVENTDSDARVHTDAEGTGSQGRPFTSAEDEQESSAAAGENARREDGTGRHLDLEA